MDIQNYAQLIVNSLRKFSLFLSILFTIGSPWVYGVNDIATSHAKPKVIAHQGGTADYPENTLLSLRKALENKADMLEISVQLSKDNIPVLYRPLDLSSLTDGRGKVAHKTSSQLAKLNAGWHFKVMVNGKPTYPYRAPGQAVQIPTLQTVFREIPKTVPIILDLKSQHKQLVYAIAKVMEQEAAWERVHFYSTIPKQLALLKDFRSVQVFESRDITRTRLLKVLLSDRCAAPPKAGTWIGFELNHPLTVTEQFTLGQGISEIPNALLWNPKVVACCMERGNVKIFLWGINTLEAYQTAKRLGVYAVITDSPLKAQNGFK